MRVRISGGGLKGRKVAPQRIFPGAQDSGVLRPTSSKVREAIFNILQNEIRDSVFVDLYAGSGTIGLEALSRGADKVYFVEKDVRRCRAIQDALGKFGLDSRAEVCREDAQNFLERLSSGKMLFDIIFADPPYASDETSLFFPLIDKGSIIKRNGCLVIEHASKKEPPESGTTLKLAKRYKYGDTMLSLYRSEQ